MYATALRHYQAGRFVEAGAACGVILNRTPRDFRALRLLGMVHSRQGAFSDAAFFLTAALGSGSSDTNDTVAALNELATAELAQHHHDAAIDCFHRALLLQPGDAMTLYNYGNALYGAGQIDRAIAVYRQGLAAQPAFAELHNNLGNALRASGKLEEAIDSYRQAIALRPDLLDPHNNLGRTLCLLDRAAEAADCHRRAIETDPNDAGSQIDLANTLRSLGKYNEAGEYYRYALRLSPDNVLALLGLGMALTADYRHAEAVAWLQHAIAVNPAYGAARMAMGNALVGLNRHAEALMHYREARATMPNSPELTHNEAIALLATGAWPEGWERLEARFAVPGMFPTLKLPEQAPFWRGEPGIAGKTILLQAEQGLGDTLQYVRYVPLLAERGAHVVLRVQPRLGRLLAKMPGADKVITSFDEPPEFDLLCPLMSLPHAFRTTIEDVPAAVPYLRTPPEFQLLWQALLGARTRPRVGIAWSGRQHLPYRSMPLEVLAPLLRRADMEFHSLQMEMPEMDRDWLAANPVLIDHSAEQKDFADAAGLVAQMDLVVTIDTSLAHLAGALALPVWIMLPFSADCRWLLDRVDTPWYPTARLFRQPRDRDWQSVVDSVVQALAAAPKLGRLNQPRRQPGPVCGP